MADVPETLDDLDVRWLSEALGFEVDYVRSEPLAAGVGVLSAVARLHLEGDEAPDTVIVKLASTDVEQRRYASTFGLYEREVRFYRELRGETDVRVPEPLHAELDAGGTRFVLVLEDIFGGRSVDQLAGCSLADAEAVVDAISRLHGRWWGRDRLDGLGWLPGPVDAESTTYLETAPDLVGPLRERHDLDDTAQPWLDALVGGKYAGLLSRWASSGTLTLCHHDLRFENLLFDVGPSAVCLLDWQRVQRNAGVIDLASFLGQHLPTDFRRLHQEALVRRYHDAVVDRGATDYPFERCWDDVRAAMLRHVARAPGLAVVDGRNDRGRALLDSMIQRGWQAACDLDAGVFLPELG
ncbi:MAG: aminoglycoside phosphotransferase family protein [Actinomycetota bacterium]